MRVKVIISKMTNLKIELLRSDMEHTKFILMDELQKTVDKLKGDRNLQFKIVRLLSKVTALTNVTMESFALALENMSTNMELFKWEVYPDLPEKKCTLMIDVDDTFFEIFKMMPAGRFLSIFFESKKNFIKRIEKSVKDDYSDTFSVIIEDTDTGEEPQKEPLPAEKEVRKNE